MATKGRTNKSSSPSTSADTIDQQLERYRSMRDFHVTAEPSGNESHARAKAANRPAEFPFVIQKHAATRLHYDFRLGWNGVLKSWAVAKGPSYVTADKRLAVQVEDHPMEYGGFEGIIPKGQYGGGTVMLWDQGGWAPQAGHTDIDEGLRTGSLKIVMNGAKMKGKWALIRMGGKAANASKPNWLLIKEHDEFERPQSSAPITEEAPDSVATGRTMEEIASHQDHVWSSDRTSQTKPWYRNDSAENESDERKPATTSTAKSVKRARPAGAASLDALLKGKLKEKLPDFIAPQLATQATSPPGGTGWLHELKLDGYRMQARKDGDQVTLLTRTGLDWTHRMKGLAAELGKLAADTLIADGEVVVLARNGTTSFADLQAAFQEGVRNPLTYFLFDLLHCNGHDLRGLPLIERKNILHQLLGADSESLRFSEHLETGGAEMFRKACELEAEGIISKRAASAYVSGRSRDWLKAKCIRQQEFVIGGFTLPSNESYGIGALLLGYYEDGKLMYAGRTGTGFTQKTHRSIRDRLEQIRRASTPFQQMPAEARRGAQWVRPELVAQVHFATWTADNLVRQASFQGLREDKPAAEVRRELPSVDPSSNVATDGSSETKETSDATVGAAAKRASSSRSRPKASLEQAPVRLTHPDKILDEESGLTKRQLADYYWAIAPYMLPHIAGRPLSIVRCPEGSGHPCFFQKHVNKMLPPSVETVQVPDKKTGKIEPYITLSTQTTLADLAQLGVLEVHPWGSRNDDLEHPDRLIVDLDPDTAIEWPVLAASAVKVRTRLTQLGLKSFLKTTGGKGLHVVVPFEPSFDWPVVKQFAHALASEMEKREPSLYLTKMTKAARTGRIYVDYLRNERGATAVAPYSPRARPGATVSMPIAWTDLKLPGRPVFSVSEFAGWAARLKRDPWKELAGVKQTITPEMLREVGVKL